MTGDVLAVQQRDLVWGVRDDGSAVMADLEYSNVTVGEMLRADEEGLLAGNPRHLVIAATGGRGGGVSPQDIWDAFVVVIGLAKYGYEGFEMGRNVAEMRRGLSRRAARKYVKESLASGFLPSDLTRLIERRSAWKTGNLEKFLRIIAEDAQTLLRDCGYRFDSDRGEWVRSDDPKLVEGRERYKRMHGYMLSGDAVLTTRLSEEDAADSRQEIEAEAEHVGPDSDEPPVDGAGEPGSGPVKG